MCLAGCRMRRVTLCGHISALPHTIASAPPSPWQPPGSSSPLPPLPDLSSYLFQLDATLRATFSLKWLWWDRSSHFLLRSPFLIFRPAQTEPESMECRLHLIQLLVIIKLTQFLLVISPLSKIANLIVVKFGTKKAVFFPQAMFTLPNSHFDLKLMSHGETYSSKLKMKNKINRQYISVIST